MKLPIKKKLFDKIKSGKKKIDFRSAYITFVCEETGEEYKKKIIDMEFVSRDTVFPKNIQDMFDDEILIAFHLK